MVPTDPHPGWRHELQRRLTAHWALKAAGIPFFIGGFFVVYFDLLHSPHGAATTVPALAIDRWIGFQPAALGPYVSLWPYVVLGAALVEGARELRAYGLAVAAIAGAAFCTYYFWPTVTPPFRFNLAQHPEFAFLKHVDASGNACPSLHVAFAVFTAIWLGRVLARAGVPVLARVSNVGWCVAIVYSALATKQHVAIDAVAGGILGAAVAGLCVYRVFGGRRDRGATLPSKHRSLKGKSEPATRRRGGPAAASLGPAPRSRRRRQFGAIRRDR